MAKSDSSIVAAQLNLILEKLTLHDQQFVTINQQFVTINEKLDGLAIQNTEIHKKIDVVVRVINDHYLKQGIEIENLQKIHPRNSHQTVVA